MLYVQAHVVDKGLHIFMKKTNIDNIKYYYNTNFESEKNKTFLLTKKH